MSYELEFRNNVVETQNFRSLRYIVLLFMFCIVALESFSQGEIKASKKYYKGLNEGNPISSNRFCADPTAVEYEGRLYVYGTSDHEQYEAVGVNGKNTYDKIKSIEMFSTDDMVNWTYHGVINVKEVAPWIINSWAPSIVSRVEADGKTHFYLYFSNSGCGVGVITATSPTGPWSDPIGSPLINFDMPIVAGVPNPFDPGVCIDDKGVGYLAFGGGVAKNGTNALPRTARIARLGADMISIDTVVEIKAPYFYEASELNFVNGAYIYTYNNNWVQREGWNYSVAPQPSQCSMSYMTTTTPLETDSWKYRGHYLQNPGDLGLFYSNNHTHFQKYNGTYYLFYHTMLLHGAMMPQGSELAFRSLCVNEMKIDENTQKIAMVKADKQGVKPTTIHTTSEQYWGATMFTSAEMPFEPDSSMGEKNSLSVISSSQNGGPKSLEQFHPYMVSKSTAAGAWQSIKNVDVQSGTLYIKASGKGTIKICLDSPKAKPVATVTLDSANTTFDMLGGESVKVKVKKPGVHTVYFVFSEPNMRLHSWCWNNTSL